MLCNAHKFFLSAHKTKKTLINFLESLTNTHFILGVGTLLRWSSGYFRDGKFETLNVEACYNTFQLLQGVFGKSRDLQRLLRQIKVREMIKGNDNQFVGRMMNKSSFN